MPAIHNECECFSSTTTSRRPRAGVSALRKFLYRKAEEGELSLVLLFDKVSMSFFAVAGVMERMMGSADPVNPLTNE